MAIAAGLLLGAVAIDWLKPFESQRTYEIWSRLDAGILVRVPWGLRAVQQLDRDGYANALIIRDRVSYFSRIVEQQNCGSFETRDDYQTEIYLRPINLNGFVGRYLISRREGTLEASVPAWRPVAERSGQGRQYAVVLERGKSGDLHSYATCFYAENKDYLTAGRCGVHVRLVPFLSITAHLRLDEVDVWASQVDAMKCVARNITSPIRRETEFEVGTQ